MRFKRGQVLDCSYPKGFNTDGSVKYVPRPMIVLRDTNENPDVIGLVYCTTQNKELSYGDHVMIEYGTEEFFNMGLDDTTYILPQINKNLPSEVVTGKRGKCSEKTMKDIDRIIEKWVMGK